MIIEKEIDEARAAAAAAEAAAAALAAATDAAAREAAEQAERDARGKVEKITMIQSAFRGWAERNRQALEKERQDAATEIQAAYRGYAARRESGEQPDTDPGSDPGELSRSDTPSSASSEGSDRGDPAPAPAPAPDPEPQPEQQPPAAPKPSCLPNPGDINRIRKRIQEYEQKLSKCEEEKAALEKQLEELLENIKRGASAAEAAAAAALRKQLDECEEKLRTCEENKAKLERELEELKRKEQELLKARLCSLLAEIRINKLVTKVGDKYVSNEDNVEDDDLKRRLELQGELFNIGFKYGNLTVMLVTACLLAGVIARGEAINILKSEGLLDTQKWIAGNNKHAVDYLNSLKILDREGEKFGVTQEMQQEHPYNVFKQEAGVAAGVAAEEDQAERDEARAADEQEAQIPAEAGAPSPVVEPAVPSPAQLPAVAQPADAPVSP